MMHTLLARVRRTIRRHDLAPPGARVLVALSGGSDSVALLYLMLELQREGDLMVAGIAHLNHRLRGAASDEDEAFCRTVAESLSLGIIAESVDVAATARHLHRSIEDAARRARYEFLSRAATSLGAERIAIGHTRNDQAETFLLRLLRGAGPVGLAGIHPRAGIVVRPLLDIGRDELREYLARQGILFREDASNLDVTIPRNRVRHEALPMLRERFSPAIVRTLSREAEIAREDSEYFDQMVARAETAVVSRARNRVVIDLPALRACPAALSRRIVRRAMLGIAPDHFVGFHAVDAVLELADNSLGPRHVNGPGQVAERCGETLVLRVRHGRGFPVHEPRALPFSYPLTVPGEVALPEVARQISAEIRQSSDGRLRLGGRSDEAIVAAATVTAPLTVRSRHQGDAFQPLGLGGRKKLQDFFVDRKVQRAARDRVPLVVDRENRILWVAGYEVGDEFRVTDPSKAVVILRMTHLGGDG
jgi:tRNA(Ile)-lysidine synthase